MGTKTYQSIIDKAEIILQDTSATASERRWPESELLIWAKDAEHEIAKFKPDAYSVVSVNLLTSGSLQDIPSTALFLIDVLCNMGTDGTTRGDIVTAVERQWMDTIEPGWMKATANNIVKHIIYDPKRLPKKYWVYPQSTGSNYLELITGSLPDNSSKLISDVIMLGDEYANSILYYILTMAYGKDADIPQSAERSVGAYQQFMQSVQMIDQQEDLDNPKRKRGEII
jgi:hypothetical protein